MEPVTIACIRWGDKYGPEYVTRLAAQVRRGFSRPHEFVCYTDGPNLPGIMCRNATCAYPGWWQKIGLFQPDLLTGPTIYFDLDTLIIGSMDWLADYLDADLAAIENWGSKPREGPLYENEISSAVMVTNGGAGTDVIWDRFTANDIKRLHPHGDQTWITEAFRDRITNIPADRVLSYKRHCAAQGQPSGDAIVCFHGRPRLDEITADWVTECWRND